MLTFKSLFKERFLRLEQSVGFLPALRMQSKLNVRADLVSEKLNFYNRGYEIFGYFKIYLVKVHSHVKVQQVDFFGDHLLVLQMGLI